MAATLVLFVVDEAGERVLIASSDELIALAQADDVAISPNRAARSGGGCVPPPHAVLRPRRPLALCPQS